MSETECLKGKSHEWLANFLLSMFGTLEVLEPGLLARGSSASPRLRTVVTKLSGVSLLPTVSGGLESVGDNLNSPIFLPLSQIPTPSGQSMHELDSGIASVLQSGCL